MTRGLLSKSPSESSLVEPSKQVGYLRECQFLCLRGRFCASADPPIASYDAIQRVCVVVCDVLTGPQVNSGDEVLGLRFLPQEIEATVAYSKHNDRECRDYWTLTSRCCDTVDPWAAKPLALANSLPSSLLESKTNFVLQLIGLQLDSRSKKPITGPPASNTISRLNLNAKRDLNAPNRQIILMSAVEF